LDGLPQTQATILNTLLKKPTPEFNALMQTREWKQAQRSISHLVETWNNKNN
jgi:beta-N-acetylhexosaminidase